MSKPPGRATVAAVHTLSERRTHARLRALTDLEIAQAIGLGEVELARMRALGEVSCGALAEVAQLSRWETLLVADNPEAAERLRFVADAATQAIGERLVRLHRSL